jgi:KDO2-lipid IV(A) lauroyltransferase
MTIRGAILGLRKLLGLDGLYRFGQIFGYCEYLLQYNRHRRIYRRLDQIYDPPLSKAEKRNIVREFCVRVRCDKMIYTIIDRIGRQEILNRLEIAGKEHLDRAVARGKGTFFMFSHQGSHHLGGILLTLAGYRLIALRDPNESPLRIYIQQQFEKTFPEFRDLRITPTNSFVRPFFDAFRSNEIVAAAMDVRRDRGNVRTVPVKLFGNEEQFLSGMTHIALRCQSVIVVGFVLSFPGYRYQIAFYPWLTDPEQAVDDDDTVRDIMQKYANIIEDHVREYPSHISKTR